MGGTDWGDVPTWVAIGVAVTSAGTAAWAVVEARRARGAGEDSARAAERSATAAEEALALQREQVEAARPSDVAWRLRWTAANRLALKNTGTEVATGVTVEPASAGPAERLPDGATVEGGQSVEFIVAPIDDDPPMPPQVLVRWDGAPAPVWVEVPRNTFV